MYQTYLITSCDPNENLKKWKSLSTYHETDRYCPNYSNVIVKANNICTLPVWLGNRTIGVNLVCDLRASDTPVAPLGLAISRINVYYTPVAPLGL